MDDKKLTLLNKFFSYVLLPGEILYIFMMDLNVVGRYNWILAVGAIALIANVVLNAVYRTKKNPDYHYEVGPTYTKVLTGFVVLELILSSGLFE